MALIRHFIAVPSFSQCCAEPVLQSQLSAFNRKRCYNTAFLEDFSEAVLPEQNSLSQLQVQGCMFSGTLLLMPSPQLQSRSVVGFTIHLLVKSNRVPFHGHPSVLRCIHKLERLDSCSHSTVSRTLSMKETLLKSPLVHLFFCFSFPLLY